MSKRKTKNEKKEQMKSMISYEPVFRLQVMGEDRVLCKYVNMIETRDKLYDEPIELQGPSGVLNFPDQGNYQILGRACACNIPGGYLLKNKKIPVFYMSLIYASQLVTGSMFNFFLYFTINTETSEKLLLPKNYVNRPMSGKFTLELMDAEGFLPYFIQKKKLSLEDDVIELFLERINQVTTEEEKTNINSEIQTEIEKKLDTYRQLFEPIEINGTLNRKKIFKQFEDIFRSDIFKELIEECLSFTNMQRSEKMGGNMMTKIPKKVLNFKDCLDDPDKINEYVNNLSSDSDTSDDYDPYINED